MLKCNECGKEFEKPNGLHFHEIWCKARKYDLIKKVMHTEGCINREWVQESIKLSETMLKKLEAWKESKDPEQFILYAIIHGLNVTARSLDVIYDLVERTDLFDVVKVDLLAVRESEGDVCQE